MQIFAKVNLDNACCSCWERVNVLVHDAGLPVLEESSWHTGHWVPEGVYDASFCLHEDGEGSVLLESTP